MYANTTAIWLNEQAAKASYDDSQKLYFLFLEIIEL